jgi:hypothetical protein
VRQIFNLLKDARGTQCSATLKMIQVMMEKGLVRKDESVRPQVSISRESTDRQPW